MNEVAPIPWVLTDFVILLCPIPVLENLQVPRGKRIGLYAVFLMGGMWVFQGSWDDLDLLLTGFLEHVLLVSFDIVRSTTLSTILLVGDFSVSPTQVPLSDVGNRGHSLSRNVERRRSSRDDHLRGDHRLQACVQLIILRQAIL